MPLHPQSDSSVNISSRTKLEKINYARACVSMEAFMSGLLHDFVHPTQWTYLGKGEGVSMLASAAGSLQVTSSTTFLISLSIILLMNLSAHSLSAGGLLISPTVNSFNVNSRPSKLTILRSTNPFDHRCEIYYFETQIAVFSSKEP